MLFYDFPFTGEFVLWRSEVSSFIFTVVLSNRSTWMVI